MSRHIEPSDHRVRELVSMVADDGRASCSSLRLKNPGRIISPQNPPTLAAPISKRSAPFEE